jgi:hypothetical protein
MKKMLFFAGALLIVGTAVFTSAQNVKSEKASLLVRNVEALAQSEGGIIEMVKKRISSTEVYKETITSQSGEEIDWLVNKTEVTCEGEGEIPCEAGIFTVRTLWNGSF